MQDVTGMKVDDKDDISRDLLDLSMSFDNLAASYTTNCTAIN